MRRKFDLNSILPAGAVRRLGQRLKESGHLLLLGVLCVGVLAAVGRLNMAVAVNSDGEASGEAQPFLQLAAFAGGLGEGGAPSAAAPRELTVVYADGEAVCAYRSAAEAARALDALGETYSDANTESVRFLQEVALGRAPVDDALLRGAEKKLAGALTVETVEAVVDEKPIPYETREVVDSQLYEDEGYVLTPGQKGLERVETLVRFENGVVSEKEIVSESLKEPVTEGVVVGGRVHHSQGNYIWPVEEGWLSSPFGSRYGSIGSADHKGVDIANERGTPILAADGGVVFFAEDYHGYGLLVKIQHENGDVTYYAHCSEILVKEGDVVDQGQVIARIGTTGVASGNHCHFELHPGGGEAADPMDYLPECPYPWLD